MTFTVKNLIQTIAKTPIVDKSFKNSTAEVIVNLYLKRKES